MLLFGQLKNITVQVLSKLLEDIEIKKVQQGILCRVVTNDGNFDTKIRRRIEIAKDGIQKLSKVLRDRKMLLKKASYRLYDS